MGGFMGYPTDDSENQDGASGDDIMSAFLQHRLAQNAMPQVDVSQSPAYQKYQQLLESGAPSVATLKDMEDNRPDRSEYQPNTLNKILAAVAGFSAGIKDPVAGITTAQKITHAPYQNAVDEWNQDNAGKLNSAKINDAAYNNQLKAAEQGVNQERLKIGLQTKQQNDLVGQAAKKAKADSDAQKLEDQQKRQAALDKNLIDTRSKHAQYYDAQIAAAKLKMDRTLHPEKYPSTEKPVKASDINAEMNMDQKLTNNTMGELAQSKAFGKLLLPGTDSNGNPNGKYTIHPDLIDKANSGDVNAKQTLSNLKQTIDDMKKKRLGKYTPKLASVPIKQGPFSVTVPTEDNEEGDSE